MIKASVVIRNLSWYKYIKNPNSYIDRKIKKLNNKNKKLKKNVNFTLLLSGGKEIKNLNRKFRNKNKATDVLSFPFYTKKELHKRLIKEQEIYLGDIIINLNKIKDKKKLKNFKEEFNNLMNKSSNDMVELISKKEKDFLAMKRIEKKYSSFIND